MSGATRAAFGVLAVLTLGTALLFALTVAGLGRPAGTLPMALDFDAFWSAARIAMHQSATVAYDNAAIERFERAHTSLGGAGYLAFYYPPSFLLLCLPLAALPYLAALPAFLAAQAALFWPVCKTILDRPCARFGWLPVLACPGFAMNLFSGQNGALTASGFGAALLMLESRPLAAGICLGALSCKPQLALAVPVVLVAARRWRVLLAAGVTAVTLAAAATLILGPAAWHGFLANAPAARSDLETLAVKWPMMQSAYAAVRMAGWKLGAGYAAQAVFAGCALLILAVIGFRRAGAGPEMAALSAATLCVTPFLYDYDLVVLAPAMAWLAGQAGATGWRRGERAVLLAAYIAPLFARGIGLWLHVPIGPPVVLALLIAVAGRALRPGVA